MKKIDYILKKAELFEKCAITGKTLKSLSQVIESTDPYMGNQVFTFEDENVKGKPPKFQVPSKLSTKEDVIKFQENLLNYVNADPSFNQQLTKALGSPWEKGDVDGIAGPRTMKAWNMYKQYAGTTDPYIDINVKREKSTEIMAQLLNDLRNKLRSVRQSIAKNTDNFTKRFNVGSDKVKQAFTPFLQNEYGQLSAGYNQMSPEMKQEFSNLAKYMGDLFESYMKSPPEEPKSLIDIDSSKGI